MLIELSKISESNYVGVDIDSYTSRKCKETETIHGDDWYSPIYLIDGLKKAGEILDPSCESGNFLFDLDPATSEKARDYCKISKRYFTIETNGLRSPWNEGDYVYMNPPFHGEVFTEFIKKFVKHQNGILLTFEQASPSTKRLIVPNSELSLKFGRRIKFYNTDPKAMKSGPMKYSALYAFGEKAAKHLILAKEFLTEYDPYIEIHEKGFRLLKKEIEAL